MPETKKILVVTLSNLGDVVLTLPVIQALRRAYPEARLDVVVGTGAAVVFEKDDRIARVRTWDKKKGLPGRLSLLASVRSERYDLIVDLRHSLIGLLGGAKRRNRYFRGKPAGRHRALSHAAALEGLLPAGKDDSFLLERAGGPALAPGQRIVVAAPGSKSDLKKWPAAQFASLLDRLAFDDGCRIVLVGDKNDVPDAAKVRSLMVCGPQVTDLTGRTSFGELVSALRQADLVITNDSAPLHIADSLGVPVLALFGPTDHEKYGPRGARSAVVRRGLFCSPCETAQCRYAHECLDGLSADAVYPKASALMSGAKREGTPRFLVVRLDRMGDVVLTLPAIQALRAQYPEAHISVMLRPQMRQLLEGHPAIDEVLCYDYKGEESIHRFPSGYLRLLSELRERRFDAAFILHPGLRSSLLAFFAGIPKRFGYRDRWSALLTHPVADRRHEGNKHESEFAVDVVRAFGVTVPAEAPFIPVARVASAKASQWTGEGPLIALHAGASCASKRWPLARFEALGQRLLSEFPHRIAIIGGAQEKAMGERLRAALGERSVDLTGRVDLRTMAAVLRRSELLVSNDSGPVHVAAAVGTPVISLFGRSQAGLSARRWGPLGGGHAVIQKDVGCVQCLAHLCPIGFECLEAIEVGEVVEAARRILSSATKKEGASVEA